MGKIILRRFIEGAPVLTSVSPDLGDIYGGALLELVFDRPVVVSSVSIGGVLATSIVQVTSRKWRCLAPALAAGVHTVIANTTLGAAILADAYEAWHPTVDYAAARVFQSDRAVTYGGATVVRGKTGLVANLTGSFTCRDGARILKLASGRLVMIGGWKTGAFPPSAYDLNGDVTNAILFSADNGATWSSLLAHNSTPPTSGPGARFLPGHTAGVLEHVVDGETYVYWIGSDANAGAGRDGGVWRCKASDLDVGGNPDSWTRIATTAPTVGISLFAVASFNGRLYVMGGQSDFNDKTTANKQVWRSNDHGLTWTQLADAPWSARCGIYWPVEWNGELWLVSGGRYHTNGASRDYKNDVWKMSAAETWTQVLADGHGQFTGRQYHSVFVYREKLWIVNGYDLGTGNTKQAFWTTDGVTWNAVPSTSIAWFPTHAQDCVVTDDDTVVMNQGIANESFYLLETNEGQLATAWADQGSGALTLSQAGADLLKPLRMPDAFGAQPGIALNCEQDMRLGAVDKNVPDTLRIYARLKTRNVKADANNTRPPCIVLGVRGLDDGNADYNDFGLNGSIVQYSDVSAGLKETRGLSAVNDNTAHTVGAEARPNSSKVYVDGVLEATNTAAPQFDAVNTGVEVLGASSGPFGRGELTVGALVWLKLNAPTDAAFETKIHKWFRKWT